MIAGEPLSGLVALVMTAVAGTMFAAALLLLRDALVARRRIAALEAELERQGDLVWDLRESEERTRSLIDGQGDLIVRRDGRGQITFVNEAFCRLAGRDRQSLVGSAFRFPLAGSSAPEAREGGVVRREEAIETAAGRRWIEWQDVPVRVSSGRGRPETQSVGRDVTARKEAEEAAARVRDAAEAANRAKSRFLATVTHEIRTPLGGLLGMADLLIDTPLAPDQLTYAKAVKSSGETLLSLIDEILDFSKIEAGRLDIDPMPFDLTALIEALTELLAPRAHAKGLEIAAHVSADLPAWLLGDSGRLKQVILNLAGNAVKFTETGGIAIRVGRSGDRLAVAVEDTGIGIAPAQLDSIFLEFEQADATPSRRFGGTGLGLAISQRIVERMGGTITVESHVGRGSTFSFSLPLVAATPRDGRGAPLSVAGRRVLVASPSPVTGPVLSAMLADRGTKAVAASTIAEAAAELERGGFDAVIADRAFGLEDVAALAGRGVRARSRVIVLVTPAERADLAALAASGAASYLIKPVRAASLEAQIAGALRPLPANDDGEAPADRPLEGRRILLAEDNEINGIVARTVLTKLGARVEWARDGAAAVALHAQGAFDAILMDMHMPGLDGPGATRLIRAAEAAAPSGRTPVFALTANAQAEDRETCLAAGMDRFLTKPLDRDQLVELLAAPLPPARSA